MTRQRAIEILQTERECALRADCDRECCRECDLALDSTDELIEAYNYVIAKLDEFENAEGKDNVNHPGHYCTDQYECIDVMIATQGPEATANYCICNAFKYIWRHGRKGGLEDVKKARWHIDKYIELAEEWEESRILL